MLLLWKTPRSGMIQFHSETLAAELFGLGTLLNNRSHPLLPHQSLLLFYSFVYLLFCILVLCIYPFPYMCFWADGDSPTVTDLLPLKLELFPGFLFFYFAGNWFCLLPPASCIILSFFFFFRTSLQALGLFYCHWIHLFYLRPILHVEHLYRYSAKKQHRGHYTVYSIGYLAVNARPRTKCMWKETRIYLI